MTLSKNVSHIAHVPLHYFCDLHIDPTLPHIQVQKQQQQQQTANFNYHTIAIYELKSNMPLKCHIC